MTRNQRGVNFRQFRCSHLTLFCMVIILDDTNANAPLKRRSRLWYLFLLLLLGGTAATSWWLQRTFPTDSVSSNSVATGALESQPYNNYSTTPEERLTHRIKEFLIETSERWRHRLLCLRTGHDEIKVVKIDLGALNEIIGTLRSLAAYV